MDDKEIIVEEPIVDYSQLDLSKSYTYWDYLKWQFADRVELIRGRIVKMSPGPNVNHQSLVTNVFGRLWTVFSNEPCRVFVAPFDVRLPVSFGKKDTTVVQPDLCVICDSSKLDKQGCNGAPDLVVEILSPGNASHDVDVKFKLYEESGVKEYWIIQPEDRTILVYSLIENTYIGLRPFCEGMTVESPLFAELKVSVDDLFVNVHNSNL
jgi:Uma2 family endonuclease